MDTLRWIIIGILTSLLLGFFLIKFFYHRYKISNNRIVGINVKKKCAVKNCESWYKKEQKYCDFHTKISQLRKQLKALNSPLVHKADMYMSSTQRFYNSNAKIENIITELKLEIKKLQKK